MSNKSCYDVDPRSKFIPNFKTSEQYATEKIKLLRNDFCVNVTKEDEAYIRQFKSEHEINSACKVVLNRHWS